MSVGGFDCCFSSTSSYFVLYVYVEHVIRLMTISLVRIHTRSLHMRYISCRISE